MRHMNIRKNIRLFAILLSLLILVMSCPILAEGSISEPVPQSTRENEIIPAPETADIINSSDGKLTIRFQPEIIRPKGDIPTFKIQSTPFDQNFVDQVIAELMQGATLSGGTHIAEVLLERY